MQAISIPEDADFRFEIGAVVANRFCGSLYTIAQRVFLPLPWVGGDREAYTVITEEGLPKVIVGEALIAAAQRRL